jgi:hypothetical protein
MANVKIGATDLSTLGLAVRGINGRQLAGWRADRAEILGRESMADLNGRYNPETQTVLTGVLSATNPFGNTTTAHSGYLTNLDALKALVDPELGYQQLQVTGDQTDRFRYVRLVDHDLPEVWPVFKKPFQECALTFDNLEPYWRKTHANVNVSAPPTAIPTTGKRTRPVITIPITGTIAAPVSGGVITPVTLFTWDTNLLVQWRGTATDGQLVSGDSVVLDCDALTCLVDPTGAPPLEDRIRHYAYSGSLATDNSGFPIIKAGGSTLNSKHASTGTIVVAYDDRVL